MIDASIHTGPVVSDNEKRWLLDARSCDYTQHFALRNSILLKPLQCVAAVNHFPAWIIKQIGLHQLLERYLQEYKRLKPALLSAIKVAFETEDKFKGASTKMERKVDDINYVHTFKKLTIQ
jgi:hypothetical protein